MKLLVDEDTKAKQLMVRLAHAGHDVVSTTDLALDGQPDEVVFEAARAAERVLLTKNVADYVELQTASLERGQHGPGVLAIHESGDPGKNMSYPDVVRAIANIEHAGISPADSVVTLNAWNYPESGG